jgi:hypothetical protein
MGCGNDGRTLDEEFGAVETLDEDGEDRYDDGLGGSERGGWVRGGGKTRRKRGNLRRFCLKWAHLNRHSQVHVLPDGPNTCMQSRKRGRICEQIGARLPSHVTVGELEKAAAMGLSGEDAAVEDDGECVAPASSRKNPRTSRGVSHGCVEEALASYRPEEGETCKALSERPTPSSLHLEPLSAPWPEK